MECASPLKRVKRTYPNARHIPPHAYSQTAACVSTGIIADLKQAVTTHQRLHVLQQLLHFLRYDPGTRQCLCDMKILSQLHHAGIVHILCLQLGSSLHRMIDESSNYVVELLLRIVALLYRYNPDVEKSLQLQGSEVMHLLPLVYQQTNTSAKSTSFNLEILSIWHSFSSSSLGTTALFERPETLPIINEMISKSRRDTSNIHVEIVMEFLGLLKNLTYYGEDYRHRIVDHTELIATLTSLTDVPDDNARERLSAVFRNLALSIDVRCKLAQRADVLTAIVRMVGNINNRYNNSSGKNILRNVLSTLCSLAMDPNSTNLILFHGDGILAEQLKHCLNYDDDAVVRKRAARALRLLARDHSPMVVLIQNYQLLEVLSHRAMYDTNNTVRAEAQEAFARCASLIRAPMLQYRTVLDSLTKMAVLTTRHNITTNDEPCLPEIVTRAVREQASHPENRRAMAQRTELTEGLSQILTCTEASPVAKENTCATLLDLSKEKENHDRLASPLILDAMVATLLERGQMGETERTRIRIRESIIRSFLNLAQSPTTWKTMASRTSLLQAMLQFASTTSNDQHDLKKQVKAVILQLASEL
jgi:hypothetical protein